ncbi:MAG: HAMP domain-containing histidine kinase [Oscillospiraceae bacterium]|nr:HAMP domain-containing histidine kinase [Oscillospiraceae bacterium]
MNNLKTKLNSLSIKYKIFLYLIGFCGLLLFLLWTFQIVLMDRIYENIRIKQLYSAYDNIAKLIVGGNDYEHIADIAENNDTCVMVVQPNGVLSYSAEISRNCRIHKAPYIDILNIVIETRENKGELKGIYSERNPFTTERPADKRDDSGMPQSMIYCRQVKNGDDVLAYVILDVHLTPVDATVSTIQRQLQFITVIMIVFSAVLASVIARKISLPMEKISRDARQLATGDYETVFDATGYAEINRLSATLTRTAEELGKVEKQRKDFIANVSHDLRTPLTLIGGYAEVMRDIPGENNPENAQMIIDETRRLSTLVNDLLDMSRIQSGAVPMEKVKYNLTQSVQKTVDRLNELLKREGYEITFDADCDVFVTADEARISQCFYNILINRVNYTGEDKKVFVKQRREIGKVKITVTDTGRGVSEKDMPYVWERYYKSDSNHKRSVTGTGLGLSIVRSVIKAHKGEYGAYNTADQGACFWFSLPVD